MDLNDVALQAKIDRIVADISTAVDTILAANNAQMVVTNIANLGTIPDIIAKFPDPVRQQRVTDAIDEVNVEIEALAIARGIPLADKQATYKALFAQVDENGFLNVGGQQIKFF